MNILTLAAVLQASVSTFQLQPYGEAYRNVSDNQKPFLVIIGADWCQACQKLKQETVPQVAHAGGFRGVEVAYVDLDRDAAIAKKLMKGKGIPQLIRFERQGEEWDMERLRGAVSGKVLTKFAQGQTQSTIQLSALK